MCELDWGFTTCGDEGLELL